MTEAAPLPENESERLSSLRALAILDTEPEAAFDAIARAAAAICQSSIALVTLVDSGRQWFKASVGLPELKETPREHSFCAHAVLGEDLFEIQDAQQDARFAGNPLVTGAPGIRAYAGAPIILSDGTRPGTVCVIERKPRKLTLQQGLAMRELAAVLARALELRGRSRSAMAEAEAARQRIEQLYTTTPVMLHSVDVEEYLLSVSDLWLAKLGYQRDEVIGRPLSAFLTPESHERQLSTVQPELLRRGYCENVDYQMLHKDGPIIDVLLSAVLERDVAGRPLRSVATLIDVTSIKLAEHQLAESEARYRAMVEDQSEMVSLSTGDGTLIFVNEAYARHFGRQTVDMLGTSLYDCIPEVERAAVRKHLTGLYRTGGVSEAENRMLSVDGEPRWIAWVNRALTDSQGRVKAIHSVGRDITERRQVEQALRSSQSFLSRTGAMAGVGGWAVDLATNLVTWSDETCRLHDVPLGHRPTLDEAIGYYTPEARPLIENAVREGMELGKSWDIELSLVSAKGRMFWGRSVGSAEFEDGKAVRLIGAFQDVTERRKVEQGLAASHELMRVTLDSIGDAVITTDQHGRVEWLNPAAEHLTGWFKDEAQGKPLTQVFTIINEETREPAENPVSVCLAERRRVGLASNILLISRNGAEYSVKDSAAPIRDANQDILGAVLVFHDVSEQRRLSREMNYRATHDPLTGLANRSEFETRLERLLARAHEDGSVHALMYVDLDQFKLVNDACGHAAGDQLLRQLSTYFQHCVRGRDTVARLGGDEFGLILEHCDIDQAMRVGQKICDYMEEFRFVHEGRRFRVGTSIGLVPVDARWRGIAALLQTADGASYAAKEAGRNRVHAWFDTDANARARQGEVQWASRLEQAIDEDRFTLFGQRIESLKGSLDGLHCEVLLRLIDTDGSLVSPGVFLPAAERFHLAPRVDRWVIRQVFSLLETAADATVGIQLIAINLSGQSIGDRSFHRDILRMLGEARFDVRKLCFEITETAAITNLLDAKTFIEQVRALGVRISLDDFGAGASSFGYLKALPVDFLKIDGQFITDLLEDPLDNVAVRSFRDVANVVGVKTIAEFVERVEVREELRALGVDMAQGYLIHRPEPLVNLLSSLVVAA